jgi:hypothetical protein
VRKLAKPPHLIMRIMDCVLLLFRRNISPVVFDPERVCVNPSWSDALKVRTYTGTLFGKTHQLKKAQLIVILRNSVLHNRMCMIHIDHKITR